MSQLALRRSAPVAASARPARAPATVYCAFKPSSALKQAGGAVLGAAAAGLLMTGPAYALATPKVDLRTTGEMFPRKTSSPIHLEFSVKDKKVEPAAAGVREDAGHFHVNIDDDGLTEEGTPIPFDAQHIHYGKGQTSADLEVPKGVHILTLQFANGAHESFGTQYAKAIKVDIQ